MNIFLQSLINQTRKPDEIVIVDAISTDKTVDIIKQYSSLLPIKLIQKKSNIAMGRNIAIFNATYEVIAVTDAGCILDNNWLERITRFENNTDIIVGNYEPLIDSIFDACQYSIMNLFKSKENTEDFVISSRSLAFKKRVWEELNRLSRMARLF